MKDKILDFIEKYHLHLHFIGGIIIMLSTYIQFTEIWFKIVILILMALLKEGWDMMKDWDIKVFDIKDVLFTVIPGLVTLFIIEHYDII